MKKESVLYGIAGLLAGVIIAVFTATTAVNSNNQAMMKMMGMNAVTGQNPEGHGSMTMADMVAALNSKTGDEFDKTFISEMIVHHRGAIDMAKQAQVDAKHDEIKKLAEDILSAQSQEIAKMQKWQTEWGYEAAPATMHGH